MKGTRAFRIALSAAVAFGAVACREEGPAEKAGRKLDEAVDKLRHGDEGALEKAGRKVDEAFDEAKEEIEALREEAAEVIEGD